MSATRASRPMPVTKTTRKLYVTGADLILTVYSECCLVDLWSQNAAVNAGIRWRHIEDGQSVEVADDVFVGVDGDGVVGQDSGLWGDLQQQAWV